MTNRLITWALGFIPGALIGGCAVGYICTREARKKIVDLEQENERLRERNKVLNGKTKDAAKESAKKPETPKTVTEKEIAKQIVEQEGYVTDAPDEFDKDTDVDFDDPFEGKDDKPDEADDDGIEPDIRVISKNIYDEDIDYRATETLYYYQGDGILTDICNTVLYDRLDIIGQEATEILDDTDQDTIYVSNDIEDKMFEIIVQHNENFYKDIANSYYDEGMEE